MRIVRRQILGLIILFYVLAQEGSWYNKLIISRAGLRKHRLLDQITLFLYVFPILCFHLLQFSLQYSIYPLILTGTKTLV